MEILTIMEQKRDLERHVQTILLSALTALMIGLGGFIWNINGTVIGMRVESSFRYQAIEDAGKKLDEIQQNLKTIEQRVSQLENNKTNGK
jgi:cobalamin biosynthesis protein CbiD